MMKLADFPHAFFRGKFGTSCTHLVAGVGVSAAAFKVVAGDYAGRAFRRRLTAVPFPCSTARG